MWRHNRFTFFSEGADSGDAFAFCSVSDKISSVQLELILMLLNLVKDICVFYAGMVIDCLPAHLPVAFFTMIQDQYWGYTHGGQLSCLDLCKIKKKFYVFDCMQYFYLIISKCCAHKTSLSMGFTTIIPSQGSLCFRTSFGYRRKYELALIHLNKVLIPRWRLEVLCIQVQCIVKSITVVWLKLTCDVPGFGSLLQFI